MKIDIQEISLDEIKISLKNENFHTEEQIERLAAMIDAHGFDVPIVIDENNEILKGEGRFKALRMLGRATAPCIKKEGLSEKQKTLLRVGDNQIAALSDFDPAKLKESSEGWTEDEISFVGFDDLDFLKEDPFKITDLEGEGASSDFSEKKQNFLISLHFKTMDDKLKFIKLMNEIKKDKTKYEDIILDVLEREAERIKNS